MPLSIKNEETEALARHVAAQTHESLTVAVHKALEERLVRLEGRNLRDARRRQAETIIRQLHDLPDQDTRPADEILGYDEHGGFS